MIVCWAVHSSNTKTVEPCEKKDTTHAVTMSIVQKIAEIEAEVRLCGRGVGVLHPNGMLVS